MTYRKLLQPVTTNACGPGALKLALRLALQFDAHLCAAVVCADRNEMTPLAGEGLSSMLIQDMLIATEYAVEDRVREAQTLFDMLRVHQKVPLADGAPVPGQASAALHCVSGAEVELVTNLARLSDLTILPHPCAEEDALASECLHAVLFESGRPVLIAPRAEPATLGDRCCLAWNGTVEAAAALGAMLPWLSRAKAVRILHAPEYQRNGPPAEQVLPYLQIHGINADIAVFSPLNRNVGMGMLAAAQQFGADLLGMGAYSHSRLRQMILGGVTSHVLGHAPMAVLMAR